MNGEHILKEILNYITDTTYNYAILIDGEWGSGKTFFVTKECIPAIETYLKENESQEKVHYVSLYGLSSSDDIADRILWTRLKDSAFFKDKIIGKTPQRLRELSERAIQLMMSNGVSRIKGLDEAIGDALADKAIYVIDDIERCECHLGITLGIVNSLVEHSENKVIIIANEKELIETLAETQNEIRYQLALSDRIKWPEETVSAIMGASAVKKGGEVDKEELDRRVKYLFGDKVENVFYQRTREKVIGVTYKYEPDLDTIFPTIIESSDLDAKKKEILLDLVNDIISKMTNRSHRNIRTFLFFLSRVIYIFRVADELEITNNYRSDVLSFLAREAFEHSIDYKGPRIEYRTRYEYLTHTHRFTFNSVKEFIMSGNLDRTKMQSEINDYIETEIRQKVSESDSLSKLERSWYIMRDQECEAHVKSVLKNLKEDKYPVSSYVFIIAMLLRLKEIGFDGQMVDDAREFIIGNIRNNNKYKGLSAETIHMESETLQSQLRDEVNLINDSLHYHIEEREKNALSVIIDDDKWVEALMNYGKIGNGMYYEDKPVFSKLSAERWIKRIIEASAEELDDFREYIHRIYPMGVPKKSLQSDNDTIKEIIEKVSEFRDTDIIKQKQVEWLLETMNGVVNKAE